MKKIISLKVNGCERSVEVEARMTLLDLVREQFGLTGAKLGCDIQVCGACTLLVDGKPVSACSMLAVDADGCAVETVEGLSHKDKLHPLQEAFMEFGALQCGYCTSGFILTAKALLDDFHIHRTSRFAIIWRAIFAVAAVIRKLCKRLRTLGARRKGLGVPPNVPPFDPFGIQNTRQNNGTSRHWQNLSPVGLRN